MTTTRTTSPLTGLEHAMRAELRYARRAADLTQDALAAAADMSVMTYRRIERGETHVDLDQLERLAAALPGVESMSDLLGRAERRRATVTVVSEAGTATTLQ